MLTSEGIYNTLIMSYPLSWLISRLYDLFPSVQWYSLLLASLIGTHFYLIARYIQSIDSYPQKAILFVLSILWMTYPWFNASITTLTVVTVINTVGLIPVNLRLSLLFLAISSLLRTNIMIILLPYYLVSYFILKEKLSLTKKEGVGVAIVLMILVGSLYLQTQDRQYNDWLVFNKARSAIVDMGVMHISKSSYTPVEQFCIDISWFQDDQLLPTDKIIAATPTLSEILHTNLQKIHLVDFIQHHKFRHWIWLILAGSILLIFLPFRKRKSVAIPLLLFGIVLLLITRDVERVTVPLIVLWFYVIFEGLRRYRFIGTVLALVFTGIFYWYASGQYTYRYFKENTALQKEALHLIRKSHKACEVSIIYPTLSNGEVNAVFGANYLFHEIYWLPVNDKEILPSGWLVRHKFFYRTHHITDTYTTRKYPDYHAFLVDDKTAFFGSRTLNYDKGFKVYLLNAYDKLYLKNKPKCRHDIRIIDHSKHFAISQIYIDCNNTSIHN